MNETLCEVAISRNLGRQPMLVVEGGREGVAASACMAVAAPGVKEGGRGLKENFPFEGDDRERERERWLEMQCGSSATCCSYLGFRHDDSRDIHSGQGSKKMNNRKE